MKVNNYILFLIIIILITCSSDKKQNIFMESYPKTVFETVADTITKNLKDNVKRVIVLTFITGEGKEHKMGNMFAERLTTDLVKQNKVMVLDRLMFKSKLQEKSLTLSGNPDLAYVKQIGDILNIDAVVIGIVTPYATGYDINCRLIDVKTGLILAAEEGYYSEKVD
jgi:TolB-like protein